MKGVIDGDDAPAIGSTHPLARCLSEKAYSALNGPLRRCEPGRSDYRDHDRPGARAVAQGHGEASAKLPARVLARGAMRRERAHPGICSRSAVLKFASGLPHRNEANSAPARLGG